MPLFAFWAAVSLLYCLTVVTIEFHSVPVSGLHSFALAFLQWLTVSVCASGVMMVLCSSRILFAVCFPLLAVFSSAMCYYTLTIGVSLTATSIEIALVNDATMWMTVVSPMLIAVIILSAILSAGIAYYRWTSVIPSRRTSLTAFVVGLAITFSQAFIPQVNAVVIDKLPYSIIYSFNQYFHYRREYIEHRDTYNNTICVPSETPPDVFIILGESLRADHLPFNGYARNTMPRLSRDTAIISFPNIYTEYTYTDASIPHILTRKDPNNKQAAYEEQSFITLFKNAGYLTTWFANQDTSTGYKYFAHECNLFFYSNGTRTFETWKDSDLLPLINVWLDDAKTERQRKLAIIHTIGSHCWYNSRYTERQARFKPDMTSREMALTSREQFVNSYDNTIIATDDFLADLFNNLRGRNAVVLFISDHGDGLGENGNYLHASENEAIHYPACFIWYTPEYARLFPDKVAAARRGKDLRNTTEAIFHTALDLGAIETSVLDRSKSLLKK